MSSTAMFKQWCAKRAHHTIAYFHLDQVAMAGLVAVIVVTNLFAQSIGTVRSLKLPSSLSLSAGTSAAGAAAEPVAGAALTMPMRVALRYVARRYRVSDQALLPVFEAAQAAGRERNIDPMLLIAVISVESGFNPYAQSVAGAQGLMQIIPRYYLDKVPQGSGELPFLNPLLNVHIGAQILQESVRKQGGLMAGLQQYGGAAGDEEQAYANKVMAEKLRLEQLPRAADQSG